MDSFSRGGKRVLSQKSIDEMTTASPSQFARDSMRQAGINPEFNYGLGLDFTDVPGYKAKGIKVIGEGGDSDDYHTMILSVPDRRISVAVMEAGGSAQPAGTAYDLLDSVLEAKGLMKKEPGSLVPHVPQPLPADYAKHDGYYGSEDTRSRRSTRPRMQVWSAT